jgi:SAM-dependent methyltransferase
VEQRLLAGAPRRADRPASLFPISLMSGAAFHRLASAAFPAGLTVARAGLFHPFVDYYGEARADLLPFLPARAAHVLEIGCGRGRTGALIQDRLGCRVTGVEQNPLVAGDASGRLWRVIVGDVRSADLDGQYDAIVASELVEHLDEPEPFFTRMRSLLAPGGRIVLSVPNVGHYSVVEDLISGRWDYVPAGLLCYTHLRFFTRRTVEDWMHRFGFDCAIVPQVTELPARFAKLPPVFAADMDSLRAKGFYVVLTEPAAQRTASTSDGRR